MADTRSVRVLSVVLGLVGLVLVILLAPRPISGDGPATKHKPGMLMAAVKEGKVGGSAPRTQKVMMDFVLCKEEVVEVSSATGRAFTTVVDNAVFYMVRFALDGGSILATCSAPDGAMAVTSSPVN